MDPSTIWSSYVRYIGAGAVAAGGIMSLIKSLPLIVTTFRDAMKEYPSRAIGVKLRTEEDMNMKVASEFWFLSSFWLSGSHRPFRSALGATS